jgi:hypothetical protein
VRPAKQINKVLDSEPVTTKVTKVAYEEVQAPVADITPKDMSIGPQNKSNLSANAKKWFTKLENLVK